MFEVRFGVEGKDAKIDTMGVRDVHKEGLQEDGALSASTAASSCSFRRRRGQARLSALNKRINRVRSRVVNSHESGYGWRMKKTKKSIVKTPIQVGDIYYAHPHHTVAGIQRTHPLLVLQLAPQARGARRRRPVGAYRVCNLITLQTHELLVLGRPLPRASDGRRLRQKPLTTIAPPC